MHTFAEIHPSRLKIACVYVWGVQYEDNLFALGVGHTRNLLAHIWDEWVKIQGGGYTLYEWEALTNPERNLEELGLIHSQKCRQAYNSTRLKVRYPNPEAPMLYYANRNWEDIPQLNTERVKLLLEKIYSNWFICWVEEKDKDKREKMASKQALFIGREKLLEYSTANSEMYAPECYFKETNFT
jgi:hypothetical protein